MARFTVLSAGSIWSVRRSRLMMMWGAVAWATGMLLTAPVVVLADTAQFDIPAQPLPAALKAFGEQAHMQLLYQFEVISRLNAQAVHGNLEKHAALRALLQGTGLEAVYSGENNAAIRPVQPAGKPPGEVGNAHSAESGGNGAEHQDPPRSRLQPGDSPGRDTTPTAGVGRPDFAVLEEIVVTAQKRRERLQDVPVPVTAIDTQSLVDTNRFRLQDYYASVPGLNFSKSENGNLSISIRGVTTGAYVTPTTGFTLDDVPFSSDSPPPDIDPNELARVEVLRGPQGTLYGASSIGGLVKYVTVDPSTQRLSGRLQVGTEGIRNGDGAGYAVSAAVNVPLTDTLAIRVNGFTHEDPGYIDNLQTGRTGVNKSRTDGGRLSALWQPSDAFTVKLSALIEDARSDSLSLVEINHPGFADLQQSFLGGLGGSDRKLQAYSATLTGKIGSAELTSLTGYSKRDVSASFDYTPGLVPVETFYQVAGAGVLQDGAPEHLSQELRLSMPLGTRINWLLGLFYTHDRTPQTSAYVLEDPATFTRGTQIESAYAAPIYEEYAAFTDLTLKLTDAFDIQLGGREGHNRQAVNEVISGPVVVLTRGISQVVYPSVRSSENSFTYLVTPRYRFGPDWMVYARIASGYRPGGPNLDSALNPAVPKEFASDKTQNYELGTKGEFLDRRLSLDASVFYILWRDIQVALSDASTGNPYELNASRAKSEGVELALTAKPLTGLTLSSWVVWNEAELTKALGVLGLGPLPYTSRFSGYASATQEFPLWGNVSGFIGASLSYVGARHAEFTGGPGSPPRQFLPSYAQADLQLGMRNEAWQGTVFVTNATDRRGLIDGAGQQLLHPYAYDVIQPRTVGLNVSRQF